MLRVIALVLVAVSWAAPARAQLSFEVVGARALGMGGAFVAVADDSTAIHWNPAGLAAGGVGMTVGWDRLQFGDPKSLAAPGSGLDSHRLTAVSKYPVAMSYGNFNTGRVVGFDPEGQPIVDALQVHHIGFTLLQSLYEGLVAGATLKYLRGEATSGVVGPLINEDAVDAGMDREGLSDGAFDIDVGVMGDFGKVRVGFTIKNLLEPTFVGVADFAIQLKRRMRLGLAVLPVDGLTLAFDVDLDTADPLVGQRRMMALGGEASLGSRVELRSGVRWSRDGEKRPIAALGGSLRIRTGLWVDGYASYSREEDRGFGVALRAGF